MENKLEEKISNINSLEKNSETLKNKINLLEKNSETLKNIIKDIEKDSKTLKTKIQAIANTKSYRIAYALRRFSHEFLKGDKKDKKEFLKWIYFKMLRKESGLEFKYNYIMNLAKQNDIKLDHEFNFWLNKKIIEGSLGHSFYEYFYTDYFGLSKEFYLNKKILDIGCGPRGSLEWANMAKERIGLDPLADKYKILGIEKHKMKYVCAGCEKIPFPDNYFDIVCSFNSLDHVDNLDESIKEIKRVIKPKGLFLLITDVNQEHTKNPIFFI